MWQNTSFRIDLSLQAAFSIFSLTTAGVWPDKPDYKGSVLALSVKFFSAFFRKSFFHRPCANLLDFSSSLICLSESAFSQCSSSPPPLKVASRSAEGPRTRALHVSLLPAGGEMRSVYNMLSFHLTRPGSCNIYLNLGPIVRESTALSRYGPLLQLKSQQTGRGWWMSRYLNRHYICNVRVTRLNTASTYNTKQKSALTLQAPLLQLC